MEHAKKKDQRFYNRVTRQLTEADPVLGRLVERVGPCKLNKELKPITTTFEALLEAITHQQLSTKAAATIFGRVRGLAPTMQPTQFLKLSEAELRGAGLSRAKTLAVHDLAARTVSGEVPAIEALQEMDDAEIIDVLTRVRGIGRWSAEMLLIFRLGRLDVLPVNDLSVQQGFSASFRRSKKPIVNSLSDRGKRWKPYRSVVSWYLWKAAELSR